MMLNGRGETSPPILQYEAIQLKFKIENDVLMLRLIYQSPPLTRLLLAPGWPSPAPSRTAPSAQQ